MKIGIDGRAILFKEKTGVEVYVDNLIKNLAQIDHKNRYFIYLHKEPGKLAKKFPPNFIFRVLKFPRFWTQIRLPLDALFFKPDVFLFPAHSLPLLGFPNAVAVVHDLAFLRLPQIFPFFEKMRLTILTKKSTEKARHIIAISNSTKNDLLKFYGLPPLKVSVVYHGYNKEVFHPYQEKVVQEIKQKYKLSDPYFIYLATLHKCNVENLIKAFKILKSNPLYSKIKLVLAGKPGWQYSGLLRLIENLNLKKEIVLPGYVPLKDLPLLLQGAVALVFPSLYEGFGLPPLEAMAVGTPVIVSSVSSLPEVVGRAGLFVDPYKPEEIARCMERLLKDKNERDRLKKEGFARASLFSWQKCARETLKVLKKVGEK